jgi:hypothetical protein
MLLLNYIPDLAKFIDPINLWSLPDGRGSVVLESISSYTG